MRDDLTEEVLACQRGEHERGPVERRILLVVWDHLKGYRRHDEDDVSGFLVQFLPQVGRLIERFRDQGLPFQHFLLRTLRWQWTTWQTRLHEAQHSEDLLAEPGTWSDQVAQDPVDTVDEATPPTWSARSPAQAQRLVLLTLKAAPDLSDDHIDVIAQLAGVDRQWLSDQVARALLQCQERTERLRSMNERQAHLYWKRVVAEDQCRREPDPGRRELWERRARLYRDRLRRLHERRTKVRASPTHLDLSRLLGIPKGTVDSALYHLKKELSSRYSGGNDTAARHEQPAQEDRARGPAADD